MPIVQRQIEHPLAYPNPKMYVQSPPHEMLQDIHFASMVGVLNQVFLRSSVGIGTWFRTEGPVGVRANILRASCNGTRAGGIGLLYTKRRIARL
jgi:hypothetical protein